MITRRRFEPKKRRELILKAALIVARRPGGWLSMTRSEIAREAECSDGLVTQSLGSMSAVKLMVLKAAIKAEHLEILAQGLASGQLTDSMLSPSLKNKTVAYLLMGV